MLLMATFNKDSKSAVRRHPDLSIPVGAETVAATRYEPIELHRPSPTVLMSIPYRKDDQITYGHHEDILQYIAQHGYEVIVADMIGTGASTGTISQPYLATEGKEQAEVIRWIADQDWSTGAVGMFGHSYGGQTALRAANEDVEELQAVVTVEPAISHYEDLYYKGGLYTTRTLPYWFQNYQAMPPSRRNLQGDWVSIWKNRLDALADSEPFLFSIRDHQQKDTFWQSKDISTNSISVPLLMVAGYRDVHPRCDIECFKNAKGPKRMLLGPWRHELPHKGVISPIDFRKQVVEWFDHFLKEQETDALARPSVSFYTERYGGSKPGQGTWRGIDQWPDAADRICATNQFVLSPDGLTHSTDFDEGCVRRSYEYDFTVGTESVDFMASEFVDTAPDDAKSLVFETEKLAHAIELTGNAHAAIRLSATTSDPLLAVRIIDVGPHGDSTLVTYGYLRVSHRHDHSNPASLEPGKKYEIPVPLRAKSHIFESGHRIRVSISASAFPMAFPPNTDGSFTIHSTPEAPSILTLPGTEYGDKVDFEDQIPMNPPDESIPLTSEFLVDSSTEWENTHAHTDDSVTFLKRQSKTVDLPHEGVMKSRREFNATTNADDSTKTVVKHSSRMTLIYSDEVIESTTTVRISHDTARLTTRVTLDGQLIFDETWDHSQPIK